VRGAGPVWVELLVGDSGRALHAAGLHGDDRAKLLGAGFLLDVPLRCGATAQYVQTPGPYSQRLARRCAACCAHTGTPEGQGVPGSSPMALR
jgi:hypothetical protein